MCLFFVFGLRDVALAPASAFGIPAIPQEGEARDGRLVVTLVDPSGEPLSAASARVFVVREGRAYFAGDKNADGSGVAHFEGLPRGKVCVLGYGAGRARASENLVLGAGAAAARLVLVPARALSVVVVEESGHGVEGARVEVTSSDPLPYAATTTSDGGARIDRLGPPPYTVRVSATSYDEVTRAGVVPGPSPLRITLERRASLAVHVVNAGHLPAPNALVLAAGTSLWPARSTTTDKDGLALITGLRDGVYDLQARLGDDVSRTEIAVRVRRGEQKDVTLVVEPGKHVRVTVTDGEDDSSPPIPGANVVLVEDGLSSFPLSARTDAHGLADLGPIARQEATVFAVAENFVPRTVAVAAPTAEVRVSLARGGSLVGMVVDDRGYPVGGATIEVVGTDLNGMPVDETASTVDFRSEGFNRILRGPTPLVPVGELGVMPGPIPDFPHGNDVSPIPQPAALAGRHVDPWTTRADGSFRASPVPPGRLQVIARHPGYVEAISEAITLRPGSSASVRLVLHQGGLLAGRVVETDGTPVGGARIELAAYRGSFERVLYAGSDGTFTFVGAPEEVQLSVARPEEPADVVAHLTVAVPDRERHEVEIVLPKLRDTVDIHVTDDRGYPIDRAEVHVAALDVASSLRRTLFTNDAGDTVLRDAVGLSLRFSLSRPGKASLVVVHDQAPSHLTFVMKEGIVGRGAVTARGGRDRLARAEVTVQTRAGTQHVHTDDSGAFVVRDLSEGRLRLTVRHSGHASASAVVQVVGDGNHDADLGTVDLSEAGDVEGMVVDQDDNPVAGARVALESAPTYLPLGPLPPGVTGTDRSGRFKLGGLPEGSISLEAYSADLGRAQVHDVEVRAGRTTDRIKIVLGGGQGPTPQPKGAGSVAITLGERDGAGGTVVLVAMVAWGSEAEAAGLEPGDEIVSINGHEAHSIEAARTWLTGPLNEDVVLSIRRDNDATTLRLRRERVRR